MATRLVPSVVLAYVVPDFDDACRYACGASRDRGCPPLGGGRGPGLNDRDAVWGGLKYVLGLVLLDVSIVWQQAQTAE